MIQERRDEGGLTSGLSASTVFPVPMVRHRSFNSTSRTYLHGVIRELFMRGNLTLARLYKSRQPLPFLVQLHMSQEQASLICFRIDEATSEESSLTME